MWPVPTVLIDATLAAWAGGVVTLVLWLGFGTGLIMRAIEGKRDGG
jgi:hypothetical protein